MKSDRTPMNSPENKTTTCFSSMSKALRLSVYKFAKQTVKSRTSRSVKSNESRSKKKNVLKSSTQVGEKILNSMHYKRSKILIKLSKSTAQLKQNKTLLL